MIIIGLFKSWWVRGEVCVLYCTVGIKLLVLKNQKSSWYRASPLSCDLVMIERLADPYDTTIVHKEGGFV